MKKISGENDGTAHGARPLSALLKFCGTRKCEEGYSQISQHRILVCLLYQKQTKNSDLHNPHISLIAEFFCMAGTPWTKRIPNCLPPQRHGNSSLFFDCQQPSPIHWPFIVIKANKFFTHPPLPRYGLQPELLESETYHFQTPHSLINQSIKVHFECKLYYYYVLSTLCVVVPSAPCLICMTLKLCVLFQGALSFSPTGKRTTIPKCQYRCGHQAMAVLVMYRANNGIGQKYKYANTGTVTI